MISRTLPFNFMIPFLILHMSPVAKYPSLSNGKEVSLFHLNILKIKKEILFLVHFEL